MMNKYRMKYHKNCLLLGLCLQLALIPGKSYAGDTLSKRDSISYATGIDILKLKFRIAGNLYKVEKYKLQYNSPVTADSLFRDCVKEYSATYSAIPESILPGYFQDSFYAEVIPVIQYFRDAAAISRFMEHRNRLHPKTPVPDPKHHDEATGQHHNHEEHLSK